MKVNSATHVASASAKIVPTVSARQTVGRLPPPGAGGVEISTEGRLTAIMSNYDVRNMSYNENKSMADELRRYGLVSEEDYLQMTAPPPDFSVITGQPKPDWNARTDIVSGYEQNIDFMKSTGQEERSIRFAEHMLSIYRELDAHRSPDRRIAVPGGESPRAVG